MPNGIRAVKEIEELRAQVTLFPKLPGVYMMRDSKGEVVYVGKAKDLRARVRQYFGVSDSRSQIEFLMRRVVAIDKVVTENEQQAFILERDLITKHKPRYNIKLKDDKAYLSIRLDLNAAWPRLELVRRVENDGARYFGPYSFSYELRSVLETIRKAVPLRSCTDTVFHNRQRPCLEYQIKRCCGPCCLPVDPRQYSEWLKQAIAILEGRSAELVEELERKMERASSELRFEDAGDLRDRIDVLTSVQLGQSLSSSSQDNRDVFGLVREGALAAVSVLKVRNGRVAESDNYSFSEVAISDQDLLQSVIEQYYTGDRDLPGEVLLPLELESAGVLEGYLSEKRGCAVDFVVPVPKRGIKARLLGLAEVNARQHFIGKYDAETRYLSVAKSIALAFKLRQMPRRIECVDISNFQGSDTVGALVCFFDGAPSKGHYKRFNLEQKGKPDDFASIYEVVSRRLRRARDENDLPDLLIIDGGAQQLAMALKARDELTLDVDIVALAKLRVASDVRAAAIEKTPERVFCEGRGEPVLLEEGHEVTLLLQRIRDEAHRFVITFHRKKRAGRVFRSKLDDVLGLGPERKRRLLTHFGSLERIAAAQPREVARIGRMPLPLAEKTLRKIKD